MIVVFFPNRSLGKESACNAKDPSLMPGSGKVRGYPLQYSWASLVAQLVKNLHEMLETRVRSLGWEDSLEKGKSTHSSILPWRIPWTIYSPWVCKESDTTKRLSLSLRRGSGLHQDKHASGHTDGRPTYRHSSCCLRSHNSHFAKVFVFKAEFIPFWIVVLVLKIRNSLDKLCEA